MTRYDLYGSDVVSAEEVSDVVSAALGIEFSLHRSDYRGGDYFLSQGAGTEVLSVAANFEDDDGELSEPEFPDYRVLLRVDGSERGEWIENLLDAVPGLTLLRSIVL